MRQRTWRDGWIPTDAVTSDHGRLLEPETMTRDYTSVDAYQRDLVALTYIGWYVGSVSTHTPHGLRASVKAWWHRIRGHPDPIMTVTYRRLH